MSDLCWSLDMKDDGWNGQSSEGCGLHWSAVVLKFSRMDLSIELSQRDLNAARLGHTVVTFCGFLASLGAVYF